VLEVVAVEDVRGDGVRVEGLVGDEPAVVARTEIEPAGDDRVPFAERGDGREAIGDRGDFGPSSPTTNCRTRPMSPLSKSLTTVTRVPGA
jgi:hypothetical protein